jgi:hypothetical protein
MQIPNQWTTHVTTLQTCLGGGGGRSITKVRRYRRRHRISLSLTVSDAFCVKPHLRSPRQITPPHNADREQRPVVTRGFCPPERSASVCSVSLSRDMLEWSNHDKRRTEKPLRMEHNLRLWELWQTSRGVKCTSPYTIQIWDRITTVSGNLNRRASSVRSPRGMLNATSIIFALCGIMSTPDISVSNCAPHEYINA